VPRSSLAALLRRLLAARGPEWIRVLYTHPAHWSEELIEVFASGGRLLPYVDLPVQHASDRVLAAMGRGRSAGAIRRLVARLRARIPGLVLRTTVMTGHPGEGRREFLELLQFLREFPFDRLGAFAYSPEPGTRAHALPGRPAARTARARRAEVLARQREIALPLQRARVGREVPLLLEGWRSEDRLFVGRSPAEAPEIDGSVFVTLPPEWRGCAELGGFMSVRLVGADAYDMQAVPVEAAPGGAGRPAGRAWGGARKGKARA
jgi:ribosomal protein S12 methylthiotransferase